MQKDCDLKPRRHTFGRNGSDVVNARRFRLQLAGPGLLYWHCVVVIRLTQVPKSRSLWVLKMHPWMAVAMPNHEMSARPVRPCRAMCFQLYAMVSFEPSRPHSRSPGVVTWS
jgi:hypothetical protein